MKRAGRNLLVTCVLLLCTSLCWVSAVATPTYLIPQGKTVLQRDAEESAVKPTALILLGAGLVNIAIWGRKRCRKEPPVSDTPV